MKQEVSENGQAYWKRLFITGLPVPVDVDEVSSFLKEQGPVEIDHQWYATDKKLSCFLRRGYLVARTHNKACYANLVGLKHLEFKDRTLVVMPFKKGAGLMALSSKLTPRRLIIKKVPVLTPEEAVSQAIREQYGPYDFIFQFKRHGKGKKKSTIGRYKAFSVLMSTTITAQLMANQGELDLGQGILAEIIRYDPNYKSSHTQFQTECFSSFQAKIRSSGQGVCSQESPYLDCLADSTRGTRIQNHGKGGPALNADKTRVEGERIYFPPRYSHSRLYVKPTSSLYHRDATGINKDGKAVAAAAMPSVDHHPSNLRLNLLPK